MLATKSKYLGASWPQGFFSKVEPCNKIYPKLVVIDFRKLVLYDHSLQLVGSVEGLLFQLLNNYSLI